MPGTVGDAHLDRSDRLAGSRWAVRPSSAPCHAVHESRAIMPRGCRWAPLGGTFTGDVAGPPAAGRCTSIPYSYGGVPCTVVNRSAGFPCAPHLLGADRIRKSGVQKQGEGAATYRSSSEYFCRMPQLCHLGPYGPPTSGPRSFRCPGQRRNVVDLLLGLPRHVCGRGVSLVYADGTGRHSLARSTG